jgi:hypothetical protein
LGFNECEKCSANWASAQDPGSSRDDRLAISPQCGFTGSAAGNPLSEAGERAKLALVVETARTIWG